MSIKLKLLTSMFVFAVVMASLVPNKTTYAHFPVKDSNTGVYASFHVTPDHDPIAGKRSVITYDFAVGTYKRSDYTYTLTVQQIKKEPVEIPVTIEGEVVKANYVFPVQSLYTIALKAQPKQGGSASLLTYSQRVSQGTVEQRSKIGQFEVVIIATTAVAAFITLVIICKDDIMKWTKKKRRT